MKRALSEKGLPARLRDWWDFLATRMNHPKDSSSELRAERPALLDDLREAAHTIEKLEARLDYELQQRIQLQGRLEELDPPPAGSDAT